MPFSTKIVLAGALSAVVLFSIFLLCCFLLTRRFCKKKQKNQNDCEKSAIVEAKTPSENFKIKVPGSPLDPETSIIITRQQTDPPRFSQPIDPVFREVQSRSASCVSLTLPRLNTALTHRLITPDLTSKSLTLGKDPGPSRRPTIAEATLVHIAKNSQLNVYIHRISNLPLRHGKKYLTYITVKLLLPKMCFSRKSKSSQKSLNPEFSEVFQFNPVKVEDLTLAVLEVNLLAKRKIRFKDIGTWNLNLNGLGLDSGQPRICTGEMQIDTGESDNEAYLVQKHIVSELGQLLVSLQYQPDASRLKVFIRKADGLPGSKGLMSPEYFVVLNVTSASGSADIKETKPAKGRKPIWNEAFLFDIKPSEIESCWLHLSVLRKKHYGHNNAVGHVTLGQNSTPDGEQHWKAVLEPRAMEVTQWHRLTPR